MNETNWPPPPTQRPWWRRHLPGISLAAAVIVAIGAVASNGSDEADVGAPATTTSTTEAPATTEPTTTTVAPTTSTTSTTSTTEPDLSGVHTAAWIVRTYPVFDELLGLSTDFTIAADTMDLVGAIMSLNAMISTLDAAEPPPADAPPEIRVAWSGFTATCIDAWTTVADAIGEFDLDGMERGVGMMNDCTARLGDLTDAFDRRGES